MATTRGIDTGIGMTVEELLRLPRGRARFELVEGQLRTMEPGGSEHGMVSFGVANLLGAHLRAHGAGGAGFGAESGFVLATDPTTVRAPDAAWVGPEKLALVGRIRGYWPGAPDFAIEVVSPGDRYSDVHAKALEWVDAGCRLLLVVDPGSPSVTAYRPGRADPHALDDRVDCSDVVPGLAPLARELLGIT